MVSGDGKVVDWPMIDTRTDDIDPEVPVLLERAIPGLGLAFVLVSAVIVTTGLGEGSRVAWAVIGPVESYSARAPMVRN